MTDLWKRYKEVYAQQARLARIIQLGNIGGSLEPAVRQRVGYRDSEVLCVSIGKGNIDPLIPAITVDPSWKARSLEAEMNRDWLDPVRATRYEK